MSATRPHFDVVPGALSAPYDVSFTATERAELDRAIRARDDAAIERILAAGKARASSHTDARDPRTVEHEARARMEHDTATAWARRRSPEPARTHAPRTTTPAHADTAPKSPRDQERAAYEAMNHATASAWMRR